MGAWPTPTIKQLQTLRVAYHGMLRRVLRCEHDEQVSNQQLSVRAQVADVRVRLALDRLAYARRVFQVGSPDLQHLLHIEKAHCASSWLDGLCADLDWLRSILPDCIPYDGSGDLTDLIDLWQHDALPWKSLLRRALRKHKLQEEIMLEAQADHFRVHSGGATFAPDSDQVFDLEQFETAYACPCGRSFTTPQGLALHRRIKHGLHAPEFQFVNGATCPA